MTDLSVTLIGPGAIGLALAAGLIDAGTAPTLVVRTPFDRLRVEWPGGIVEASVECVSDAAQLSPADVVIVATKATQNADITEHVRAATGQNTILVIAQNGVDHRERFQGATHADTEIVPAIVMLPSQRSKPGHAVIGRPSKLVVPEGPSAAVLESLFDDSFIEIEASDDWTTAAWLKLMLNASSGGIGVLTRKGSEIFTDPAAQQMLLDIMHEVAAVGRAEGAVLADELPHQLQQYQISRAGGHTTSIVLDRIAGTPTEWRERNEVVVRLAAKHGLDVPLSTAITTLMRLGEPDSMARHEALAMQGANAIAALPTDSPAS